MTAESPQNVEEAAPEPSPEREEQNKESVASLTEPTMHDPCSQLKSDFGKCSSQ